MILWVLRDGLKRFSEVHALVSETIGNMITKQLRELKADGLVVRTVYPVVPPKTEYALTDFGRNILPLIIQMARWDAVYLGRQRIDLSEAVREACGLDD